MNVLPLNFYGNPNIGLYGYCTDEYCLLGKEIPPHYAEKIEKALKVPVYRVQMCGTSLIGVFCAGNSTTLLLPSIVFPQELKQLDAHAVKYTIIHSKLTALGNNILCNNMGCLVNPEYSADVKKIIRKALCTKLHPGTIAEIPTVGSCAVLTKKGGYVHHGVTAEEHTELETLLGVSFQKGTVNFGTGYVRSGILANSHGMIIGESSTGIEMNDAADALIT